MSTAAAAMTAVPVASSIGAGTAISSRPTTSVRISSVANFAGRFKLNISTRSSPSPSARTLVVRAEDEPNVLDNIKSQADKVADNVKGIFGNAQQEADKAASKGKAEYNKASSQAKGSSGDFENQAADLKDNLQAQAEEASEKVKSGIQDLQNKVQDAADSAKN